MSRAIAVGLLIVVLGLVAFPRFDRQDLGIVKKFVGQKAGQASLGDSPRYTNYVEFFRGRAPIDSVQVPYAYRPLVPGLASLLPVDSPMTSLNLINLASLYLTALFLFLFLRRVGFDFPWAMGGCFMFALSFPVFYYGTIGLTDPAFILMLTLGTWLVYKEKWLALLALVFAGSLVKEVILLVIPVAVVYQISRHRPWLLRLVLLLAVYLIPAMIVRYLLRDVGHYYWKVSLDTLLANIRPRALISTLLTLGTPGLLAIIFGLRYKRFAPLIDKQTIYPLIAGTLCTLLLVLFSLATAHTDGRFIWPATVFTIPMALWVIRSALTRKSSQSMRGVD